MDFSNVMPAVYQGLWDFIRQPASFLMFASRLALAVAWARWRW